MMFSVNRAFRGTLAMLAAAGFVYMAPDVAQAQDDELAGLQIEEIVVTARKRDESLQEVPLAVSAVTAMMVEQMGLRDLDDIAKITPGLSFDPEFNRTSNRPVIRGQANILGDSGVSYFIDGVYITGSINDYDINDVERIEIVKGPQSALYGRNTYSGAINIVTKSPGDSFAARARAAVTDDGQQEVNATIKGPLGDSFGVGLTGRYFKNDGPFTNAFDGSDIGEQESTSASLVASFEPSDRFSARFRAYWAETDDGQSPLALQPHSENNCFFDAAWQGGGRYFCGNLGARPIDTDWSRQAPDAANAVDHVQGSLALNFQFNDSWSLASITGYNSSEEVFIQDGDYLPTSYQHNVFARFPLGPPPAPWGIVSGIGDFTFSSESEIEDVSQELRLRYEGERSEFLLGAYYFDQNDESLGNRVHPPQAQAISDANFAAAIGEQAAWCATVPFLCTFVIPLGDSDLPINNRDYAKNEIENTAIFGMAAFDLTDATRLTVEGRYAEEKKDALLVDRDVGGPPQPAIRRSKTFRSFNPRITLDHRIDDDTMIYGLVAQGNKPGGFNGSVAEVAGVPTFDEEEVTSYEFGIKNTRLDGRLIVNASMFFNEIEGYQLTQTITDGTQLTSAIVNAGDAELFGFEIETRFYPESVEGLSLSANYAFVDSEFVNGADSNQGQIDDVADNGALDCSTGNVNPNPGSCTPPNGSIVGNEIPRSANHQFFIDAELRRPMGNSNWDWFVGANYSFESDKYVQVLNLASYGETTLVNARLGFQNERFSVMLWGKNLTGEDSSPLGLRYLDIGELFRRAFVISARRDTYWGLTATVGFE